MVVLAVGTAVTAAIWIGWHQYAERPMLKPNVEFNRDIRPILNQRCVICHGGVKQQSDVSFVYRDEALGRGKSGLATIVPGYPERSELMARVTSNDPEYRMPYDAPPLWSEQIELLRQWIEDGAHWEDHWAFVAPQSPALPEVVDESWPRQPIDRFVLARLETEGLEPSPEAEKVELLRRVSFDLTGLPPTPEELSSFLSDTSGDAYEKQVDRLLASPHYGERWATVWLDLARYADSRDYAGGSTPTWPYRDWVIDAYNRNLPYDQFVIAQLAGDLLPDASTDKYIATSFHRQTPANDEAGSDDEEYRVMAVMDRVGTTWSVLNGITMNCVQCHSHPYDPIRHQEYYQFFAWFNTSRDADLPDESPTLPVAKEASRQLEVAELVRKRAALLRELVIGGRSMVEETEWMPLPIASAFADEARGVENFLNQLDEISSPNTEPLQKLYAELIGKTQDDLERASRTARLLPLEIRNGEAHAPNDVPAQSMFVLESDVAPRIVTALRIEVPPLDPEEARKTPEVGFIVDQIESWIVEPTGDQKKIDFRIFVHDSEDNLANAARVEVKPSKDRSDIAAKTGGFAAYSKQFQTRWVIGIPEEPLHLVPGSRLKVTLKHTQAIGRDATVAKPDELAQVVEAIAGKPTLAKRVRLETSSDERWFSFADEKAIPEYAELTNVQYLLAQIPSIQVPIIKEQAPYAQRPTFRFERGEFLRKVGTALSPEVPEIFPELPADAPRDRLTLARWFFSPEQPLTARVVVNRYWEQLFSTGIVETLEDFGSAGQSPSHPKLLDWLAMHFQNDLRWDMKSLLRELVTSATYRQSAAAASSLQETDPSNRLLARGPQQRLTAEMVHDQALNASGLLNPIIGGPPVGVPQADPSQSVESPERYRRAIYISVARGAIYSTFLNFDASDHRVSLARRIPTNTPLQALTTLNEPFYHRAAIALGKRMYAIDLKNIPSSRSSSLLEARLNYGARCVLSRDLFADELDVLQELYNGRLRRVMSSDDSKGIDQKASLQYPADEELAAYVAVATVLFNLDAALTR